jgi:hypothetical protein
MLVGRVVFKRLWDSFFWRNSDTELFMELGLYVSD